MRARQMMPALLLMLLVACSPPWQRAAAQLIAQDAGDWAGHEGLTEPPFPDISAEQEEEQQNIEREQSAHGRLLQEGSSSEPRLTWHQGILVVRTLSLVNGDDGIAYLLKRRYNRPILELVLSSEELLSGTPPGTNMTVRGQLVEDNKILVTDIFPTIFSKQSRAYQAYQASGGMVASLENPSGGGASWAAALTNTDVWQQARVVTDMSVLVMVASICNDPQVAEAEDVERVIFQQDNSFARTLQGYFSECSRGQAFLNRSNSMVVGQVRLPCNFSSGPFSFNTKTCSYGDSDGWHMYAQQYAQRTLGVDITRYKHKVLLMPRYYTMRANCPWIGQGTLGPDSVNQAGDYLSSKVWLSGEYWNVVMAYMHELGHTNYLHHAMKGDCPYCDVTCLMGGCCDTRCFNAPHNWQLGWSRPLARITSVNLQAGQWRQFVLPAQNQADDNLIMIQPDWVPGFRYGRAYMWFLGYRVQSGRYDEDLPDDFTFSTNIYWWDGMYQVMPSMTRWMAAVYDNEQYRNNTDMFVVRQVQSRTEAAVVAVCQMSQLRERSCNDGLDNDCDGLADWEDPDCNPLAGIMGSPTVYQVGDKDNGSSQPGRAMPPPPHPVRPPRPPSPPMGDANAAPSPSPSPSPPLSPPPPSPRPPPSPSPRPPPSPSPPKPKSPRSPRPPRPPPSSENAGQQPLPLNLSSPAYPSPPPYPPMYPPAPASGSAMAYPPPRPSPKPTPPEPSPTPPAPAPAQGEWHFPTYSRSRVLKQMRQSQDDGALAAGAALLPGGHNGGQGLAAGEQVPELTGASDAQPLGGRDRRLHADGALQDAAEDEQAGELRQPKPQPLSATWRPRAHPSQLGAAAKWHMLTQAEAAQQRAAAKELLVLVKTAPGGLSKVELLQRLREATQRQREEAVVLAAGLEHQGALERRWGGPTVGEQEGVAGKLVEEESTVNRQG